MEFHDPLSPPVPIIHCSRHLFQAISYISTELLNASSCWSFCIYSSVWRFPREYIAYELSLLLQQCPWCLVRLTWIVFMRGGKQLFCGVLPLGLVQTDQLSFQVLMCLFPSPFSPWWHEERETINYTILTPPLTRRILWCLRSQSFSASWDPNWSALIRSEKTQPRASNLNSLLKILKFSGSSFLGTTSTTHWLTSLHRPSSHIFLSGGLF